MNLNDRKRLKANHIELVRDLRVVDVVDLLYRDDCIDDEEMQILLNDHHLPAQKQKVRRLLDMFYKKSKPQDLVSRFCFILRECESNYGYLAEGIERCVPDTVEYEDQPDSNCERSYSKEEKFNKLQEQVWSQTETMIQLKNQYEAEIDKLKETIQSMEGSHGNTDVLKSCTDENIQKFIVWITRPSNKMSSRSSQTLSHKDKVEAYACGIGVDIIEYAIQRSKNKTISEPVNRYAKSMRKLFNEFEKHPENALVDEILATVDIRELTGQVAFQTIADELFQGGCSWGRIVAWYGYWAKLATRFQIGDIPNVENFDILGNFIGFYVFKLQQVWIEENGDWVRSSYSYKL